MSTAPHNDRPADDGHPGMPTWVRWTLVAVLVLVVVLVVLRFVVGGDHGPGRHLSAPTPTTATAPPFDR